VRFARRLARDVAERGRSAASVAAQYEQTVRPMHERFVEPSRCHADVVIVDGGFNDDGMNRLIASVNGLTGRRATGMS
jgi:uridine kinase